MNKSRGRRPGNPDTRGLILEVAAALFREQGYAKATLRSVASAAGVDVALVSYYFGSKHGLFAEALTLTVSPAEVMQTVFAGGRRELPARTVAAVLRAWGDPEDVEPLRSLLISLLVEPHEVPMIGEYLEREILGPLAEVLGGDQRAREEAAVVVMLLAGVVITRQLMGVRALASVPDPRVHDLVGAAVRSVVDRAAR